MKVLVLSHTYPKPDGNRNCFVHGQVKELARQGCDVRVISPVPWAPSPYLSRARKRWMGYAQVPRRGRVDGIDVLYPRYPTLPYGRRLGLQGIGIAIGAWRSLLQMAADCDVIHAHMVFPDGVAVELVRRLSRLRIPICVTAHGSDVRKFGKHRLTRSQVGLALRSAAAIVTGHPEIADLIREYREDVHLIPNGIDVDRFRDADGSAVRKVLDTSKGTRVVTFVANLIPFKDPETFVRAAQEVSKRIPSTAFLIVGNGKLMPQLKSLVREMALDKSVHFLGYRNDVLDILAASDAFVATSPIENIWSTTILEAFASQVPCVITDAGTTRQHLSHGKDAYLVSARNPSSVAEGIIEVLSNDSLSRTLSQGVQRLILDRFDIKESARRLMNLYRSLVAN